MEMAIIDALQGHALLNKGLCKLSEIYRQYKNDNPDLLDPAQIDAIEYFLTQTQNKYAEDLKTLTDELK